MKTKLFKYLLSLIILSSSLLNLTTCSYNMDIDKIKKIDNSKKSQKDIQYIENSSFLAKTIVLTKHRNLKLDNVLNDVLSSTIHKELKTKLQKNFNVDSLLKSQYDSLFASKELKTQLLNFNGVDPLTQIKDNYGFFSVIKLVLFFIKDMINESSSLIKSDFLSNFLQKRIEQMFHSYNESELVYLQKKISEHNDLIKKGLSYSKILPNAVKNVKENIVKIINLQGFNSYDSLMKKAINIELDILNLDNIKINLNLEIQKKFLENLKKIDRNFIDLIINAFPLISYILEATSNLELKNVEDYWVHWVLSNGESDYEGKNLLSKSKSTISKSNEKKYLGLESILNNFSKKIDLIVNWDSDNGLNLRKLLIVLYLNKDLYSFFEQPLQVDFTFWGLGAGLVKRNVLQLLAANSVCGRGALFKNICKNKHVTNIFGSAFSKMKSLLESDLNNIKDILKNLSKIKDSILIEKLNDNNILFILERFLKKINLDKSDIKKLTLVQNDAEDFFDMLNSILNPEKGDTLIKIWKDLSNKIGKETLISLFEKINNNNFISNTINNSNKEIEDYYLYSLFKDSFWKIEKKVFKKEINHFSINYLLIYKIVEKKFIYEVSFKTVDLFNEQLILTKFNKIDN